MIFGIGTDMVEISRVNKIYARFPDRFARRLLMPQEFEEFQRCSMPARFLSMRIAAKEAIVKAMGTGFSQGVRWKDVGITKDEHGKPGVVFSASGHRQCAARGIGEGFVSLSDEAGLVIAYVILMTTPVS